MAEVIRLLLEDLIPVDLVEKWLNEGNCGDNVHQLDDKHKPQFVSIFLNFLRNESNWILPTTSPIPSHSGHTKNRVNEGTSGIQNDYGEEERNVRPSEDESNNVDKRSPKGGDVNQYPKKCTGNEQYVPKFLGKSKKGARNKSNQKSNQQNAAQAKPAPDINDLDAFPPMGTSLRRITPTPASAKCVALSPNASNDNLNMPQPRSVFTSTPLTEKCDTSLKKERQLLKEVRLQQREVQAQNIRTNVEVVSKISPSIQTEHTFIVPKLSEVKKESQLNTLADLYIVCIASNLVSNLSTELVFIFQLLTAQVKKASKTAQIFSTVHNCVYFAVRVLAKELQLIMLLDLTTLKLMAGLPYICEFSQVLVDKISDLQATIIPVSVARPASVQGVAYKEDLDNRKTFPTDNAFHVFCRQRDQFYELFRDWTYHQSSNNTKFSRQVQHIVGMGVTPTNFSHLARLIISQMIMTCYSGEDLSNNPDATALKELQQNSMEKLDKLKQRMLTPSHPVNPNPAPSFQGAEIFFHEFIIVADSASLNRHLVDLLKEKLEDLNKTEMLSNNLEPTIDVQTKEQFWRTLTTLQLLGKFLGFIIFLPYQDVTNATPYCSIKSRSVFLPLDLLEIFETAKSQSRLVLTIPWIVEYLSMLDVASFDVEYYRNLICKLIWTYRNSHKCISNTNGCIFLQLTLGKLFEMPKFPQSLFFLSSALTTIEDVTPNVSGYDNLDVFEKSKIFSCMPHMPEIRILLKDHFGGIHRGGKEVRKITPVPVDDSNEVRPLQANQKLQKDLEDNFFHLHPSSVKSTVEFVADCISSKAIKQVKQTVMPQIIQKVAQNLETDINSQELYSARFTVYNVIKEEGVTFASEYCKSAILKTMTLLLPEGTGDEMIMICSQIACRIALSKVTGWMKSLITIDYLGEEISNHLKHIKEDGTRMQTEFNFSILDLLSEVTESVRLLYVGQQLSASSVCELLERLGLFSNCKIFASVVQSVKVSSLDWAIAMVVHQPSLLSTNVLKLFANLWYNILNDQSIGVTLLSPRNVQLTSLSLYTDESWRKFADLVCEVCQHIGLHDVIMNSLTVIKQQWPSWIKANFRNLLKGLLEKFDSAADEATEVKAWIDNFKELT